MILNIIIFLLSLVLILTVTFKAWKKASLENKIQQEMNERQLEFDIQENVVDFYDKHGKIDKKKQKLVKQFLNKEK